MQPKIIGEDLFATDAQGRFRVRIATVFPRTSTIVTLPGIHASQRVAYSDVVNRDRAARGLPAMTESEEEAEWMLSVDLIIDDHAILIRPDPDNMELAFEADEFLQHFTSKKTIQFLHVLNCQVRDAIRNRGELWRINALPRSPDEMKQMIAGSMIAIGGRAIYYYNKSSGARFITYQRFAELGKFPEAELRQHLLEIKTVAPQTNRLGTREINFFAVQDSTLLSHVSNLDFQSMNPAELSAAHASLLEQFRTSTLPEYRRDDLECAQWRGRMFAALIGQTDKAVSEEGLLGLSAEFFMQMEWLPGGRIEDGELILDSVFEEEATAPNLPQNQRVCDEKTREYMFNFIRDYGELDYVNIGRIVGSLSLRKKQELGRRGVYLAEVKQKSQSQPMLRVIRMQKWGVWEHLDEGKDLLTAILEAEQYTEYVLDRRLGCRQLGMNVPPQLTARKIDERYNGRNESRRGTWIWTSYFERDYIPGLATDKIPTGRYAEDAFAISFARLLGRAAAPNLIVGRCDLAGNVIFDDGDELVFEDARGIPSKIIVADHTGTFGDYRRDLIDLAPAYAAPINERYELVNDPIAFGEAYLQGFSDRFRQIQSEFRKRRRAFETLFRHERRDEGGSFCYRWERVLARLNTADPQTLVDRIRQSIPVPASRLAAV